MVAPPAPSSGGALDLLSGLPSFSSSAAAASGPVYASMNSPFVVGGSGGVAQSSLNTLTALAPWAVAGVVAWAILRR